MYVKLNDGVVEKYPYSISEFRRDNPDTSFPKNMTDELLAEWNVFPVSAANRPEVDHTKNVIEKYPTRGQDNRWVQVWEIIDATPEEIAHRTQQQAEICRSQRDDLLSDCDWTQITDATADKSAWLVYRQALRDVPSQPGFPWQVSWPAKP